MEVVLTIILALAIALILAALIVYGFQRRAPGPLAGLVFFLVMLFFTVWVGALWIEPTGPEFYGIPWLAMLVIGLLVTLIITAVTAPAPEDLPAPDQEGIAPPSAVGWGCGLLFWMAIAILMMAAVARYTWFATPPQ